MPKLILIITVSLFIAGMSCSVKNDINDLQKKKVECENLQPELDMLGSKKYTKKINQAIKDCKDHGFWTKPERKKINTYMEGL